MQKAAMPTGMHMAVGVSLGLSIGMFAQNAIINKFFPNEPVQEKIVPTVDTKMVDAIISQNRKINQLENQLGNLMDDIQERNQQVAQTPAQVQRSSSANVFELSEVIEANNLANKSKYQREFEEQRKLMIREHLLKVEGEVLKVHNYYRPTINKIKKLEAYLENQRNLQKKDAPAKMMWISCQALLDKLRFASQEPLEKDPAFDVLRQFATQDNPLAVKIIDSIPPKALREGIQSEESLITRFSKVESICKKVALVDANGGGIGKYLVSYLQSLFIMESSNFSEEEISGKQLVDPSSWTTFDILARVKYCLSNHNLEQAVRYANQLKGQARVVARDWIRDARTHLIAKQAFSTLSSHAEAIAVDSIRQAFAE